MSQPSEQLSLEKVQKTAIVKMDLQHGHVEASFFHCRCKRRLVAAFKQDSTLPTLASEMASPVTSPSRDIGNTEENGGDGDGKEDDEEEVDSRQISF